MLIFDFNIIGNKLLSIRKQSGLTQAEVAESAGLSDRTYADIERGTVNMRTETLLRICNSLNITPDEILTEDTPIIELKQKELINQLDKCSNKDREIALRLLSVFLQSLN